MNRTFTLFITILFLVTVAGCGGQKKKKKEKKKSILKQTTQEIGKFDPNAGWEIQGDKVEVSNPVTGPLEAYGPLMQQVAGLGVQNAVNQYYALEGKYPTYEQFMEKIIKGRNMKLPVLPNKAKYMYDVENHKLVVIKNPDAKKEEKKNN